MPRNTTLLIKDDAGNNIDITQNVVDADGSLLSPRDLNLISGELVTTSTSGMKPALGYKRIINPLTVRTANTSNSAEIQKYTKFEVKLETLVRGDVLNRVDLNNIQDLNAIGSISAEAINQNDHTIQKLLMDELAALVASRKIYSTTTPTGAPDGIQPNSGDTTADVLTDIAGGRVSAIGITDLDADGNADALVSAAIDRLVAIGSPDDIESEYPFNTGNGLPLSGLVIVTNIKGQRRLSSGLTNTLLPLQQTNLSINRLVGNKDTVSILVTNILPAGVDYIVMAKDRVLMRKIATSGDEAIIGELKNGSGFSYLENGTLKSTQVDETLITSNINSLYSVKFFEEAIIIGGA